MIIANDPERRQVIHSAPDTNVHLSTIIWDLWPKLGFLPIDQENPGVALIAEFMLNELILKNSESLEELNLQHLKELFNGDDEADGEDQGEGQDDDRTQPEDMAIEEMEAIEAMDMEGAMDYLDMQDAEALREMIDDASQAEKKENNKEEE